jgi:RHH-type transcriptional regulator, proline utilization regulon repressor / proline dehydrogenase / delta 1-pyrroline-5-carboxylate dehydrogenase
MAQAISLDDLRGLIRDHYLIDEAVLTGRLMLIADLDPSIRNRAQEKAADFVRLARDSAERSGLIDKFLQEYGLSTAEGVTLMRLAEALLRTPDAATANALIEDKIEAGDWRAHKGASPFPLVNFSTRALMLTAAWLDDIEAKDPLRRMAAATKAAFDRLGEPVIRASVAQAMRIMGEHFVLGQTIDAAMKRGRQYTAKGYLFSFDMLGEAAHTAADADQYYHDYENAITAISNHCPAKRAADNPGISVKLSALHPRYEYGQKARVLTELGEKLRTLALAAKAANMGFTIDAEEVDRLDLSLDLIEMLMRDPALADWQGFGVVIQAYQRRATYVLDWLAALARDTDRRVMVRLVKGAYWDSEIKRAQVMGLESYPVFTRKVLTDLSYIACARRLFAASDVFYPQFATHNALTATTVQAMAEDCEDYELQRLHGMGEALHDNLIDHGARSRIYAPVGGHKELLPYLVRRLLENGANSSFVNQLIDPDLSVDDVVADPLDEVAALDVIANPNIPAPRDHLNGERLAAKGWDETHPPTAEALAYAAREPMQPIAAKAIIKGKVQGGDAAPIVNPANTAHVIGSVETASADDIAKACASAADYAESWAQTPASARADALRSAADLLEERGLDFMTLAVFEAGKTWPDAIAELREAVDFLRYYAQQAEQLPPLEKGRSAFAQQTPGGDHGASVDPPLAPPLQGGGQLGAPLGVVACISPWNFPLAIFLGQVSAALAAGNCVIAKPAEQTPLIAFEAVKLLRKAGVPVGALHYLPGDGPNVGAPLVAHPSVNGVIFTGSTAVAKQINQSLVANGKYDDALIAETGGVNVMIVDSTALLEQAVTDTVASAFQSAGQRCSACRVVCVQDDIAERFNEMLAGAMAELSLGDPSDLSTDVGPVIDEDARAIIEGHIARLEKSATLIARAPQAETQDNGVFVRPAAFAVSSLDEVKDEIFGPVLQVVSYTAEKLSTLIDQINALGYGLTLGIHTRIDETMHAIAARARVGNIYVNRNQIGAVVGVQPFGGEGLSGTGPKAGGPHYLKALQKRRAPAGGTKITIAKRAYSDKEESKAPAAHAAFEQWRGCADRGAVFKQALETIAQRAAGALSDALNIYYDEFSGPIPLPGPTGESNTLRLRPRGVVLCLGGGSMDSYDRQIALALAAGNAIICTERMAQLLRIALEPAGAPGALATGFGGGADVPTALLADPLIRAVIFDGDAQTRREIAQCLADRAGAITPLLTSEDAPWRFAVERTLTINTTAAGGDVRLLSLGE